MDFVYDTIDNRLKKVIRKRIRLRCPEVIRLNSTKANCIIIGPSISPDTDRTPIRQCSEILGDLLIKSSFLDFLTINQVGILDNLDFFRSDFTNNTDSKTRSWERLTIDNAFRKSKKKSDLPDFILEEILQRLNKSFKGPVLRKTANVMMGFDLR